MPKPLAESIEENIIIVAQRRKKKYLSTSQTRVKDKKQPGYWANHLNNPYYVLENRVSLSKKIAKKIINGEYKPHKPTSLKIPKKDKTSRELLIYNIVDEAVSLLFFRDLIKKNSPTFNHHSYGYRSDVSIYDAINYAKSNLTGNKKIYIAEYDFSKYFDSINHKYIFDIIKSGRYYYTKREIFIIKSFLERSNGTGIPQGTALSMFLANVSLTELDDSLDALGISFIRFADDLILWDTSYERLAGSYAAIQDWSKKSKVNLNYEKSIGIQIFKNSLLQNTEFKSTDKIIYLNHVIKQDKISISNDVIKSVKKDISRLIQLHLIQTAKHNPDVLKRIDISGKPNSKDRDYISFIWSLRRLIYGELSESKVDALLQKGNPEFIRLSGRLSAFVASTDLGQLENLDNWLKTTIYKSLQVRKKIIKNNYILENMPTEWNIKYKELISLKTYSMKTEQQIDLTIPSFKKMHILSNKLVKIYGSDICKFVKNYHSNGEVY